jgi:ATP-dependent phosphofructokinase / diphosphate-dependent phosphofructokinase
VLRSGNVVIAQGGGPTAVINASLYGIVRECVRRLSASSKIRGARGGIEGVLQERWLDLREPSERFWKSIVGSPGAALGSCRKRLSAPEAMEAVRVLQKEDVRYFFYIGGNDSMDTALKMHQAASALHYEMTCCGIPKTIDNDLPGTDHCPGFGSAARFIAQSAMDLGTDVRTLPTPVSILEVMGRDAGWLTAATLLARKDPDDAPHLIYVPERRLARGIFLRDVQEVYDRQGWVVVAVSEGVRDETGKSWGMARGEKTVDGFGHQLPGDVATRLAGLVTSELGLRARSEKPGLLGRSCALMASSVDRREAREVGSFGFSWAIQGNSGFMVSIIREDSTAYSVEYGAVPLTTVANLTRLFPAEYVAEEGNDIQAGYRAYVEPLIGHPLLRYARLDALAERPATT